MKNLRTCPNGHEYYKSSDCPVCPICDKEKTSPVEFPKLPAPARRALENAGISTLKELSNYSEAVLLELHGIGPGSIPALTNALKTVGLSFRKN